MAFPRSTILSIRSASRLLRRGYVDAQAKSSMTIGSTAGPRSRRNYASMPVDSQMQMLSSTLEKADPAIYDIIEKEKARQKSSINLIPSENFTSQSVLEALGSIMQSKFLMI
jgi:glycine hydroxymethyltransferase